MLATGPQYLVSTHEYLAHRGLAPHENVWFDRDDVARGIDTVVQAALEWIAQQPTGVEQNPGNVPPRQFALRQNHPNPFNPTTQISYTLAKDAEVNLAVFNLAGQLVRTLVRRMPQNAGTHFASWDGKNEAGDAMASGVYVYRLEAGGLVDSKKMILLR